MKDSNLNLNKWVVTQANTNDNYSPVVVGTYDNQEQADKAANDLHTKMLSEVDEANPQGGGIQPYVFGVWSYLDYHNTHCEQGEEI